MAPQTIILAKLISITLEDWNLISPLMHRRSSKGGRPPANARLSLEGMRWVGSTGKPWSQMPAKFGKWETVKRYYGRLKKSGVIAELLNTYPERAAMDNAETTRMMIIGDQLACLQLLAERPPRGRAAAASTRSL